VGGRRGSRGIGIGTIFVNLLSFNPLLSRVEADETELD